MFIAIGKNRFDKRWKNQDTSWSSFIEKLSKPYRTRETISEYKKMTKSQQVTIKDVGGFVGGKLKEGRRIDGNVISRTMLTLDMDYASSSFWDEFTLLNDYTACLYSTHNHSRKTPRYRLILPLSRKVSPDEYEAVARKLAEEIGIDYFDDTTYQPSRLMFWPSVSADGEYIFESQEGNLLDVDHFLNKYLDWKDISFWPMSSRVEEVKKRGVEKQGDPTLKEGYVGAFCRTYTISDAIDTFLINEYARCDMPNRYTYLKGSSAAGLVVYEDKWAYSNHATDPCSMKLCNAYDLVRIHMFGHLDIEKKENTPINRLPSVKAMRDFINSDEDTKKTMGIERIQEAREDFDTSEDNTAWLSQLEMERGEIVSSISNIVTIFENDPDLKGCLGGVDLFANKVIKSGKLPWWVYDPYEPGWNDDDDANMRLFLEKNYRITGVSKIIDAQRIVHKRNAFNPLKDYLDTCVWDGTERLDTLFIDYLGVDDSEYTRMATRKAFTAAVKRVYEPGIKFDYMIVLYGPQGVGKSRILSLLGRKWFTDNLKSFKGKEAQEIIQGQWIIELSELSALKHSEVEESKQFVSMQVDRYRKPYERNTTDNPRTCVFFGTTNRQEFLKDNTGNRRYWPLDVVKENAKKNMWKDLTEKEIQQVWAEARNRYELKEPMWLGDKLEKIAWEHQERHREESPYKEDILEYLDTDLPSEWYHMDLLQRRDYLEGESSELVGIKPRDRVNADEVINERLYKKGMKLGNRYDVREVNDIIKELPNWEYRRNIKFPKGKYPRTGFVRR